MTNKARLALLLPFLLLAGLAQSAAAQDGLPRGEAGLLYERLQVRTQDPQFGSFAMDGITGTLAVYANRWLAFKAEFSGAWGRPSGVLASLYGVHVGAQIARRSEDSRWTPWAHVLIGQARSKFDVMTEEAFSVTDNTSSYVFGGGLDIRLSKHYAWRLGDVSYVLTRFGDQSQHNFRYKGGFLFRW